MRGKYSKGTQPIPTTYWRIERVYPTTFRTVGYIKLSGKTVSDEMDSYQSIHHHEPHGIARRIAHKRFPNYTTVVTPIEKTEYVRVMDRQAKGK